MEKKKVLVLADFLCATGFAQVAHNIIEQLNNTGLYEFDIIAINYDGNPYDREKYPYNIYPATSALINRYREPYGRVKFLDTLKDGSYDIAFIIQDIQVVKDMMPDIVNLQKQKGETPGGGFATILYYPVDCYLNKEWIEESAALVDFPITYTNYAKNQTIDAFAALEGKLEYIYHGVDTNIFKPIKSKAEIKKELLKMNNLHPDTFIFTNINRLQPRKDIPATLFAYKIFKDKHPDIPVLLYLHMQPHDVGGNLFDVDKKLGLVLNKDWIIPQNFNPNKGYPIEAVNEIYNFSDAIISTTLGEGWGFSMTEAMAAKTPVIFPDNTALSEIINTEHGFLVKSGTDYNLKHVLGNQDNSRIRPKTDVYDLADKMKLVYDNYQKPLVQDRVEAAYSFAKEINWDTIGKKWADVFSRASKTTERRRKKTREKTGRNEPCPNHPEKKFKKCCGKTI